MEDAHSKHFIVPLPLVPTGPPSWDPRRRRQGSSRLRRKVEPGTASTGTYAVPKFTYPLRSSFSNLNVPGVPPRAEEIGPVSDFCALGGL